MAIARNRGPWTYRALVWGFTVALGLLCFWLIGFALKDVGDWPGPDYGELERRMLDPQLLTESDQLTDQIGDMARDIERDKSRQQVLQNSTQEAQRTMGQLLDFQRLAIEKGVNPTAEEQKALADSQQIFLDNQRRYQELNQQIATAENARDDLLNKKRGTEQQLNDARRPVQAEFDRLMEHHRWRIAAAKLAVILPLLVIALWLFFRWRSSAYAPLSYAFGSAVVLQLGIVMNDYFPKRYFKYILIGAALVVVLRALVYLLRLVAHPKGDWLVGQYREAYERFLCPVCEYPIRRGPLKYLFWTRRTAKKLPQQVTTSGAEEPYTCPMCATRLFAECPACHGQRHTLLPACEHCGATRTFDEIASDVPAPLRS
ncbi:MAG TPA: hypothetical protein VGN12_07310 [Pirellulales bacterium]|jgi:hypothetical protein